MNRGKSAYFLVIFLLLLAFVEGNSQLTNLDYEKLVEVKNAIQNEDANYLPAYLKLVKEADKALIQGPFSVMQKKQVAASGDKQDYLSLAPYWWPDPDKDDGLPWIRKDGEINPMTRGKNVDQTVKNQFINSVKALSLAYFFSDDEKYAIKAKELLKVWFVDKETRMNPNLNYAQGIPGKNNGRGFGIIEFLGVVHVINAIEILELKKALPQDMEENLKHWLQEYLVWLQQSEFGIFEKTRSNNHGSLYDVQQVALLLFFDRIEEAKIVLASVFETRIDPQIEVDGSQPHELERTKALTYSILNLSALTRLAFYGKKISIDIWDRTSMDGDLQKAHDFLHPYLDEKNTWPYEQLGEMDQARERLRRMFVNSGSMLGIPKYCDIATELRNIDDVQQLIYPCLGQ